MSHRNRNAADSAWFASGLRAGSAAALVLGLPILLLGWFFLVDREAASRQSDFGDFLLARAAAGGLILALLFASMVRAAAESAAGATSLGFYVLAALASVVVGIALTAILMDAARWIAGDVDRVLVALFWVAGPWVCGGVLPLLFRRRLEE